MTSDDERNYIILEDAYEFLPPKVETDKYEPGRVLWVVRTPKSGGDVELVFGNFHTYSLDLPEEIRSKCITTSLNGGRRLYDSAKRVNAGAGADLSAYGLVSVSANVGMERSKDFRWVADYEGLKRIKLLLQNPLAIQAAFYKNIADDHSPLKKFFDGREMGWVAGPVAVLAVVTTTYTVESGTRSNNVNREVGIGSEGGQVEGRTSAGIRARLNLFSGKKKKKNSVYEKNGGVVGINYILFRVKDLENNEGIALSPALLLFPGLSKVKFLLDTLNKDGDRTVYVSFSEIDSASTDKNLWGMLLKVEKLKDDDALRRAVDKLHKKYFPNSTGDERTSPNKRMLILGLIVTLIVIGLIIVWQAKGAKMLALEEKMQALEEEIEALEEEKEALEEEKEALEEEKEALEEEIEAKDMEMAKMCHPRFKIGKLSLGCRSTKTSPSFVDAIIISRSVRPVHDNTTATIFAPRIFEMGRDGGRSVGDFSTPAILRCLALILFLAYFWRHIFGATRRVIGSIFFRAGKSIQLDVEWITSIQERLNTDGFIPIIHSPEALYGDSLDLYVPQTIVKPDGKMEKPHFDSSRALKHFIGLLERAVVEQSGDTEDKYVDADEKDSPDSKGSSTDSTIDEANPASPARTCEDR
eukprot:CAMPEP_0113472248 /NCGR_PEP_ID=MMETSP0014_2-20120614/17412_1 /TAXON_ID=2857 /ORGANISM="Nitzschia sp." /LENGTH=639 /DNA_ID=CAMNT_0000364941 /DNA_START=147 /DNA_END=2066 /DNA_ORIENTATION=- /assembly_acc=CAM_ASM_000159